ncbi:hypothetical protein B0A48_12433 [Cryoendolithus antarcticus]|uniref:Uncharacterized protein n=1 Tax=Cryoendolithus antarcticus TaxID=1507870 RepID=A0A1V8SSA8_9PEZI|nr:hypothetical protein B0A48_12433 [Cryoendolithus antarcticus]
MANHLERFSADAVPRGKDYDENVDPNSDDHGDSDMDSDSEAEIVPDASSILGDSARGQVEWEDIFHIKPLRPGTIDDSMRKTWILVPNFEYRAPYHMRLGAILAKPSLESFLDVDVSPVPGARSSVFELFSSHVSSAKEARVGLVARIPGTSLSFGAAKVNSDAVSISAKEIITETFRPSEEYLAQARMLFRVYGSEISSDGGLYT